MTEEEPFKGAEDMEPTRVALKGPNMLNTLDSPPRPHAVKAQDAAMRKHLQDHRSQQHPPDPDADADPDADPDADADAGA
jgi:hypothetical protein